MMAKSEPLTHRASNVAGAFCPSAMLLIRLAARRISEPSDLGIEMHVALARLALGDADVAWRHVAGDDEKRFLMYQAVDIWNEVSPYFPRPRVELELRRKGSIGHVDVVSDLEINEIGEAPLTICILDWKSGRVDTGGEVWVQLSTYAWQLLENLHADRVLLFVAWIRDGRWECLEFTKDSDRVDNVAVRPFGEIDELGKRLEANLRLARKAARESFPGRPPVYPPFVQGDHCRWCPVAHLCPETRRDVVLFAADNTLCDAAASALADQLVALQPAELGDLYHRTKIAERFVERMKTALRAFVLAGGRVVTRDGFCLTPVDQETRRIEPAGLRRIARQFRLDQADVDEATRISNESIESAVKRHAPAREKKKTVEAFRAALRESEALDESVQHVVRETHDDQLEIEGD